MVEFAEKTNQQPKLSQKQLDNIQKLWNEFTQSNEVQSQFNVQNAIEEAFSKKSSSITKLKLKRILSKLNGDMANQVSNILKFELKKSSLQIVMMIHSLHDTNNLIKDSKQFRESSKIRDTTIRSKEHLDNAKKYYQIAVDEINRMENSPGIIESRILREISFNLNASRIESDFTQRELNAIIDEINSKLESLSSAKNNHLSNIGRSLINLVITALEYINQPIAISTETIKLLIANAGLHTINAVGHGTGFYWTQEEINKLKECQLQLDPVKIEIQNSFNNFKYGMEKLEQIKRFSSDSFN